MTSESDIAETYYGEPLKYDKNFKGPLSNRSCTDIICLLIFIVFLGCWAGIGWYAITRGDLDRLLVPTDTQNRKCGVDTDVIDKPYLVFFNLAKCIDPMVPITGCPTPQVCVHNCPSESFFFNSVECMSQGAAEYRKKLICDSNTDLNRISTCNDIQTLIDSESCAQWYLQSEPFLKRCISPLPTTVCPRIPTKYLSRHSRDTTYQMSSSSSSNNNNNNNNNNDKYQKQLTQSNGAAADEIVQCEKRRQLGEQMIMDKVRKTDTILARFVGNVIAHISNTTDAQEVGQMIVEDVITSWWQILIALVMSMIICLIFIILMRWLAAPLIWLSIIGVIAMLGYGIYYSSTMFVYYRDNPPPSTGVSPNLNSLVKSWLAQKDTWMYILIILSIILFIILLIILVLRARIIIAIALVKEGSKAVSSTTSSVFFPIFPWILQVGVIIYAVIIGLYLASVGEQIYQVTGLDKANCVCTGPALNYENGVICDPFIFNQNCHTTSTSILPFLRQGSTDGCTQGCQFKEIQHPTVIPYFHAINVIGFFWVVFFISALGEMVLAATFATWYWTFHKSNVPFFTLTVGLGRTVRYHLGTLAFGSLIITICRIIRVILEYIDRKLKKYDNAVTKAIMCCLKCFFWMLESFLKFLNKNAYIMCAIHGKHFCASAKDAFNLLMRNFLRVVALDKVTEFLFFLTKVLATVGIGALSYLYFSSDKTLYPLHYNLVPVIIVMIGTYLIATVFFGVYSMAVDTLFLCFLEDCERNDGSPEKPYFMSKQLMKILGKKNAIPRHEYN